MNIRFFNKDGDEINKKIVKLRWIDLSTNMKYEHYMIKEIYEQPIVSKILLDSLETEQIDKVNALLDGIEKASKVVFIAAGSSYNSSLIGSRLLRELGYEAYSVLASEYDNIIYNKDTLVIVVSQSGETMDAILAIKALKGKVKDIFSIVNVPYSTIERLSSLSLEIKAGPERCVAATKTYTNQVVTFYYLANKLGMKVNLNKIPIEIRNIIESNKEKIENISKEIKSENSLFIIGRGLNYFSSLEIALKLKEISYIHAEALPGGELKHGTLALIEEGTKVLALSPSWDNNIKTNIEEVLARGGVVYEIPKHFNVSESYPEFSLYSVIIGQLLTYYIAREKKLPIDYPRNLAKSVTVK